MRERVPLVSAGYGMSETVGQVTFTPPAASDEQIAGSIGLPVPEYAMRIADASGTSVMRGQEGEIQVKGDFVFLGYFNRPDATAEAFTTDGWLRTGDIAVERADGYWRLVGRMKEMFKSGGYNVYPREIEICLESHPHVDIAAVIAVPDPLYQEVGYAFCLSQPGHGLTVESLRDHCRTHLANYKVPKLFAILSELPMLPVGKVDRQALRRLAENQPPR
jgi:fatty-acyl-CoA synthase